MLVENAEKAAPATGALVKLVVAGGWRPHGAALAVSVVADV
jgi:hypothetical protein